MKKRVLITGGTGFIGSNVVEELIKRGYEVHSLVYPPFAPSQAGLVQHEIDLMDTSKVESFLKENPFENLIHLAWYVGKGCHSSNFNLDWTIATLALIKSFHQNGGKCFLGAGSVSEYEYKYGYLQEDTTPTDSGTLYGNSKNAIYNIAKVFCAQNGINFKWTRIFNLYGPGEKPQRLMPYVINACLNKEEVLVSDCLKYQDYLHVKDTARGIVDVFESDLTGAVNICSAKPIQLREIVQKIADMTNYRQEIYWGAIPASFGDNFVIGNNDKLKSTGWKAKYSLENGLLETIEWWKENNKEILNV